MNDVLRIVDMIRYDFYEREKGKYSFSKSIEKKVEMGFNAEHFAYIRRKFGGQSLDEYKDTVKVLKEYLRYASEKGLRVIVYFNVHWYNLDVAKVHPEWFQVDFNGKIIDNVYGNGVMSCVNTPWRDYSLKAIREIAKEGPYGIFLDGPAFRPNGCYCKYCRKMFEEKYGINMPIKGDLRNPYHRFLIEFQEDSMAKYLRDAYKACKDANPNVLIYFNGEPLRPNWASGRNNRKLEPYQDLVGAEGGFIYQNLMETPIYKPGMTAKFLEMVAPNKPRIIFNASKHCPWNRIHLTPAEIKILCAETLANGAYYWLSHAVENREAEKTFREINSWIIGREDFFKNTVNYSNIGLYWSYSTANIYGGVVPESDFTGKTIRFERDYMNSFLGAYELLVRTFNQFKIVDYASNIGDLDLLILPNCAVLSKDELNKIREFVRNGGVLISSFETSLYDEIGNRLKNFFLKDVFGVDFLGIEDYGLNENYIKLNEDYYLQAYRYVVKVNVTSGEKLALISENSGGYYQKIVFKGFPAIVGNKYGKGYSIYFAGDFFRKYYRYKFPRYISYFEKIVKKHVRQIISVENAPRSLEIVLRRRDNTLFIHLINYTSELKRPIENIVPIHNVVLNLNISSIKNVETLSGQKIEYSVGGNCLKILLPKIEVYEVVRVE